VRHCGTVIVEPAACEFTVHVVQAFGLCKPAFFPEFLDDAFAGFGAGRRCLAFLLLGELGFFEAGGDGAEDAFDGGLDLVFLGFDFEFYVADFHFDFDWGFLGVFGHVLACSYCILLLCKMYKRNS
jgi:hypothetical protein